MKICETVNEIRRQVKANRPLVHCITNPISINQCANAVLAIGGRPIMAEHPKEVSAISRSAAAILLNLGNITDVRMEAMRISACDASSCGIPLVLDLVGVACSSLRMEFAKELLRTSLYEKSGLILKGNYSEITALSNEVISKGDVGVDADPLITSTAAADAAKNLAVKYNCIVLASGKEDIVTDGVRRIYVKNGTPAMANVTGTGCMLGAVSACFASCSASLDAALAAAAVFGIAGELAQIVKPCGTGSFMVGLMDSLSTLSDEQVCEHLKTEGIEIEEL